MAINKLVRFFLDEITYKRLKTICFELGISMSQYVRELVITALGEDHDV